MLENQRKNYSVQKQRERVGINANKKNNVILIGMPASGKSTVGPVLARYLGYGFLDLDQWIEISTRQKTTDLIANVGEVGFRKLESDAIYDIEGIHNHVIATGGGIVEVAQNWENLKSLGITVWIDCPVSVIAMRLISRESELKKRPLLSDRLSEDGEQADPYNRILKRLEDMFQRRKEKYLEADLVIGYSFSTPEDGALRLKSILETMPPFKRVRLDSGLEASYPGDHDDRQQWDVRSS